MPVEYERWQRRDGTDRDQVAVAALDRCRHLRALPLVESSMFFWADYGSTVVILTHGDTGMYDAAHVADNSELIQAALSLDDLAKRVDSQTWSDANNGQRIWQQAGGPSGT